MILIKFICAVITRSLFILISLIAVLRVASVKENKFYWSLSSVLLPLVVEMFFTLKRRKGKDYKWFSPSILLFLMSIIPSMWILELDHHLKKSKPQCKRLDSIDNWKSIINTFRNKTKENETFKLLSTVCDADWILVLHQMLLIVLILGKWLLPLGEGVTRDKLAQLLLIFVGTAADILEFTSETISDVANKSLWLVYLILSVWTWSMLQFPLQLSVAKSTPEECDEGGKSSSLLKMYGAEIWNIMQSLFIQDGPFLVVRLMVMICFEVLHPMLIFFSVKNFLMIILNLYYLVVICQDYRSKVRKVRKSKHNLQNTQI